MAADAEFILMLITMWENTGGWDQQTLRSLCHQRDDSFEQAVQSLSDKKLWDVATELLQAVEATCHQIAQELEQQRLEQQKRVWEHLARQQCERNTGATTAAAAEVAEPKQHEQTPLTFNLDEQEADEYEAQWFPPEVGTAGSSSQQPTQRPGRDTTADGLDIKEIGEHSAVSCGMSAPREEKKQKRRKKKKAKGGNGPEASSLFECGKEPATDFAQAVDAVAYYINSEEEESKTACPTMLMDKNATYGREMMRAILAHTIGNNHGMGDGEIGSIYDINFPPKYLRQFDGSTCSGGEEIPPRRGTLNDTAQSDEDIGGMFGKDSQPQATTDAGAFPGKNALRTMNEPTEAGTSTIGKSRPAPRNKWWADICDDE
mmetsp:Transcript_68553/g.135528  ORF Transcript_68553/g.135528 Transcript_68553/m.135528 type:complete len:374 (+) Transcript_68553:101-1222(+)